MNKQIIEEAKEKYKKMSIVNPNVLPSEIAEICEQALNKQEKELKEKMEVCTVCHGDGFYSDGYQCPYTGDIEQVQVQCELCETTGIVEKSVNEKFNAPKKEEKIDSSDIPF